MVKHFIKKKKSSGQINKFLNIDKKNEEMQHF